MFKKTESNFLKGFLGVTFLGSLALIAYVQVTAPERATEFLETQGFSNIEVNRSWLGSCSKGVPLVKYTAIDENRRFRSGGVCTSLQVRFDQ